MRQWRKLRVEETMLNSFEYAGGRECTPIELWCKQVELL